MKKYTVALLLGIAVATLTFSKVETAKKEIVFIIRYGGEENVDTYVKRYGSMGYYVVHCEMPVDGTGFQSPKKRGILIMRKD